MSRVFYLNLVGITLTLLFSVVFGGWIRPRILTPASSPIVPDAAQSASRRVPLGNGLFGLKDTRGNVVALRDFRRIASTSLLSDRLLVELCEPDRIIAFSAGGSRQSLWAYQYAGKAQVEGLADIETIVQLKPDLVLTNTFNDPARVTRLREIGIEVFDLGEMHGLTSLLPQVEMVAELVGRPERGALWVRSFSRRLRAVAAGLGDAPRRRGLYVAAYGAELYGGGPGTGYHDVLTAAGLIDAAEGHFSNWPHYQTEDLLALDPDILVTKARMSPLICRGSALELLRACRTPGALIELPAALVEEPGPAMLDAAEELFARVYDGARDKDASR